MQVCNEWMAFLFPITPLCKLRNCLVLTVDLICRTSACASDWRKTDFDQSYHWSKPAKKVLTVMQELWGTCSRAVYTLLWRSSIESIDTLECLCNYGITNLIKSPVILHKLVCVLWKQKFICSRVGKSEPEQAVLSDQARSVFWCESVHFASVHTYMCVCSQKCTTLAMGIWWHAPRKFLRISYSEIASAWGPSEGNMLPKSKSEGSLVRCHLR